MYIVKLCKGLSYSGFIHATVNNPTVELETKEDADLAVATGYFVLVSADEPDGADDVDIKKMSKPQLEKCAEENGIDLTGCKNNEERITRILAAEPAKPDGADDGDFQVNMSQGE